MPLETRYLTPSSAGLSYFTLENTKKLCRTHNSTKVDFWNKPIQEDAEDILTKLKTGSLKSYGTSEKTVEIVQENDDMSDEREEGKVEKVTRKSFRKSYYFFQNYEKLIFKIHKACQIGFQLYQNVRKVHGRKPLL